MTAKTALEIERKVSHLVTELLLCEQPRCVPAHFRSIDDLFRLRKWLHEAYELGKQDQSGMIPRSDVEALKHRIRQTSVPLEYRGIMKGYVSEFDLITECNQLLQKYPAKEAE